MSVLADFNYSFPNYQNLGVQSYEKKMTLPNVFWFFFENVVFLLCCSFFCAQKNEPKKGFAKIIPPLRSGNFRNNVFVAFAPHIFFTLRPQPSLRAVGEAIYLYCFCIPYGMHRSVKNVCAKKKIAFHRNATFCYIGTDYKSASAE